MRWFTASPMSWKTIRRSANHWSICLLDTAMRCIVHCHPITHVGRALSGFLVDGSLVESGYFTRSLRSGVEVKIWGGYWDFLSDGRWTPRRYIILRQLAGGDRFRIRRDDLLARAYQGREIYADDYARALTGSKIGLGLLRNVCPDQHTTRTFEIPACGSLLLADRTEEHQEFFEEGREAEFFASSEELLDKVKFYYSNEFSRERIARAGYERCIRGGYAYCASPQRCTSRIASNLVF